MTKKPVPNYSRYDFDRFIERVLERDLDFRSSFAEFDRECIGVENAMRGRGGPQARADGGVAYIARLKRVMFWFHHGDLADQGQEAATCRRFAEKFVASGEFRPEALTRLDGFTKRA